MIGVTWLVSLSKFQATTVLPTLQHSQLVIYFKQSALQKELSIPYLSNAVNHQLPGCDLHTLSLSGMEGEGPTMQCSHQVQKQVVMGLPAGVKSVA
jgi:hypothetical protein